MTRLALFAAAAFLALAPAAMAQTAAAPVDQAPTTTTQNAPATAPATTPKPAKPRTPKPATAHRTLADRFAEANTSHDGHLTPEQSKKMPRVLHNFSAIDKDHKGYVTLDDINAWEKVQRAQRAAARAAAAKAAAAKSATPESAAQPATQQ